METFVVRLWVPEQPGDPAAGTLRGVVEHVGSGRSAAFADDSQLVAFLGGGGWTTTGGGTRQAAAAVRVDGGNRGDVEATAALSLADHEENAR